MPENLTELLGLFFIMALQVVIPPIPAEVIVITSGNLYGVTVSSLVAGTGLYLGSFVVYRIGNYLHRRFDRFFSRDKIQRVLRGFHDYGAWILWIRVLPYNPSDLISYAAGIARIERRTFLWISFFTSYIRCFLLSYLGTAIVDWKGIFVALGILILSAFVSFAFAYGKKP